MAGAMAGKESKDRGLKTNNDIIRKNVVRFYPTIFTLRFRELLFPSNISIFFPSPYACVREFLQKEEMFESTGIQNTRETEEDKSSGVKEDCVVYVKVYYKKERARWSNIKYCRRLKI